MKRKSMPGGGAVFLLVKCLALAAVDGASVWLAFTAAPGFHVGNFPWALLNLLVVLVFADTAALLYPYLKRRYGASYARGWCLATGGYYLLTMALTMAFYWRTPGPLFTAMVGGAMALYAAAVAVILLTRRQAPPPPGYPGERRGHRPEYAGAGRQRSGAAGPAAAPAVGGAA